MKRKPETSYGQIVHYPKGVNCLTLLIIALLLLSVVFANYAQEPINPATPIPPPVGYMDSCNDNALMLQHFGPNCLNPVTWDIAGMPRIGTWMSYIADDGSQVAGWLIGFSWQFQEARYYHYMMRPLNNSIYLFYFEAIPPERVR